MADPSFDLVVVGAGPGGYVAAIRAAQLGMKTALVEREHLGGICLNWGCIPTKALLRSSEIYHLLQRLDEFGFSADNVAYDTAKVVARSRALADRLARGVAHLLKKNGVTVIDGEALLAGPGRLEVHKGGEPVAALGAAHIVIATGARARDLPDVKADGKLIWSYKEAMVPERIPESLLVIGSGAIGMEFASFFARLGAAVTVVEILDRILPAEDEEISAAALEAFRKRGMQIHTGASVDAVRKRRGKASATIRHGDGATETVTADRVVLAVGITGNIEDIGLEEAGVATDRGHIVVNEWMETGVPGVYAIGDVCGPPWLAHKASHEGVICVEKIAGLDGVRPLDSANIPGCTYCDPQIASVGLTERAAREAGHEVRVGRFPYAGNGKALVLGEAEGMVKTVFDAATGELLGAHMIGAEVTELIQGYGIAKTLETTESELMHTVFAHPTLSETMHEAVLDAYGRAIHF